MTTKSSASFVRRIQPDDVAHVEAGEMVPNTLQMPFLISVEMRSPRCEARESTTAGGDTRQRCNSPWRDGGAGLALWRRSRHASVDLDPGASSCPHPQYPPAPCAL
ncbi:uncharacterized protein CC84DRAFT_582847 [Paraphaeosphaeria sporulosa]|uniref:Uncharacterized protein n=1 Tax=Paraphaeosphaeria sporulosa TaxID=1460663 RepID=A0A177CM19_9PLEO|nr:uncharacterized protein CC84DRAFT_582847 [Paraphaeosphaeria sporulosa]OAG08563.1 hypothetical protein CC84DRAFT_582847 [Paraphaeosphaeria sporulosa]